MEFSRCAMYFVTLFVFLNLAWQTDSAKLNKPRVLIPLYSQYPNNFTLQVDNGGCYKWTTKTPNIVKLTVLEPVATRSCSDKAVVTAVTNEDARHTAIVFAEDVNSGEILRCDVIVDSIASLSIVTTTREIYIEEAPEVFEVQAYDVFGNQFSTLDGFVFEWTVSAVTRKGQPMPNLTHKVIKLMKFEESSYKVPSPSLAEIESAGFHGNKVLLYGIGTGQARVSVGLQQPQYENVKPAPHVILAVMANLVLDPQDTLLMPDTKVRYRLELVRQGRLEPLPLPSEQYQLEVEDGKVATLAEGSTVLALKEGRTRVLLKDNNAVDDDGEGRAISATVRVGQPAMLELDCLPTKSWYAVVGREYRLVVKVLDANKHAFHIGDDVHITITISEEHFRVLGEKTGEKRGLALMAGSVPVVGRLRNTRLSAQANLIINDQIRVVPENSYLPWLKSSESYEIPLFANAKTGDGEPPSFLWGSKTPSLASVNQEGLVHTRVGNIKPGASANISVSLGKDPLNIAFASVTFLPPCSLRILRGSLQAEVGSILHLPIAIHVCNSKKLEFAAKNCQHLDFDFTSESDIIYNGSANEGPAKNACTSLQISSNIALTTKVTVSYDFLMEDGTPIHLEDTATVGFYNPLRVVHPASGETVLAPGTSRNIIFEGGPKTLPGQKQLKRQLSLVNARDFAEAWDLDQNSVNVILARVQCNAVGNTELQLVLSQLNDGVQARGSVKIFCAFPDKLVLTPNLPEPDYQHCVTLPGSYVTLANHEFELMVSVYDRLERRFDNISSLVMDWSLGPPELAPKLPRDIMEDSVREDTYGLIMPGRMYHVIKPHGLSGVLNVKCTLHGQETEISGEATVALVEEISLHPSRISVYNHTTRVAKLKVSRGSASYLITVLEGENVADVQLVRSRRIIEVTPREPGRIRLSISDACLPREMRSAVVAEVVVLGVSAVQVVVASQVELGRSIEATLLLQATDGEALTPPSSLPIVHHTNPSILDIKQIGSSLKFTVTGLTLGDSPIKFAVDDAESAPANVHVFPPIKIWPRDLLLVPGAMLQALTLGGPKIPDATLVFSATTPTKPVAIHSSQSGMLEALHIGTSQLTVRAFAPDDSIYSEDTAPLQVVDLASIEMWVPTRKLEQGCHMPAYVQGKSEEGDIISPFVIATLGLKFTWSEHSGSLLVDSQESLVHIEAMNVGVGDLSVEVILKDGTRLTHSVLVEVIPDMRLTLPSKARTASPLLIAPHSKVQLAATNGRFFTNCGGEKIISVSDNGMVTSHGPLGRVTVTIADHKTNQELEVLIKVVPVQYIMTHASAPLSHTTFPRGMKAPLEITYHDSIGREIMVPSSERSLNWMSSRPQTLIASQDYLQMGEPGRAVLDVWDHAHHAYVALRVKQVIAPLTLTLGDHVCYNLSQAGEWSSQPRSVLHVDSSTGWAVARMQGETNLQFNTVEGGSTWAEIQVMAAAKVQLLPPEPSLAISPHMTLMIPFIIKGIGQQQKLGNLLDSPCTQPPADYSPALPVECRVTWEDGSWDDTLQAVAAFNFKTGTYLCNITTRQRDVTSKLAFTACVTNSDLCSEKLTVPFYKSIAIDAKEIIISSIDGGSLFIRGPLMPLGKLSVATSPGLEVGAPKEMAPGSLTYPIIISPVYWSLPNKRKYGSLVVSVLSPLTGQNFVIPVVVEDNLQPPMCPRPVLSATWWGLVQELRGGTIIVFSVLVIIATSLYTFRSTGAFSKSSMGQPTSSAFDSASGNSPFAPRSPILTQTKNFNTSGSAERTPLPYASTSRVYGNQHDNSWHAQGGGSPRLL